MYNIDTLQKVRSLGLMRPLEPESGRELCEPIQQNCGLSASVVEIFLFKIIFKTSPK